MGVVDDFLNLGHRIHGSNIFAGGERILHFSFDELPSPYPFALDFPQNETELLLASRLEDFGIKPEYGTAVTAIEQDADGVTVHTEGAHAEAIRVSYVIGCDGAHSTVRNLAGIAFAGTEPDVHFVLADLRMEWDRPDDEWYLWFHEDGLFSLFPLGQGMYRVIAESGEQRPAAASTLRSIIEERGPSDAHFHEPVWVSGYGIADRKVENYRSGRIFLAGDAAHVQSPATGQGMNTGIQDAHNLGWKIGMVARGNAPESLLDSYSAEREPVARSVLDLAGNMMAIATLRHPVSQTIRNRLIPILASLEVLQHRLVNGLAEISVNYRQSPIVAQAGRWYTASPVPGDRATGLHELLRGGEHVVLLFTGEHPEPEDLRGFANIDRYMRDGYAGEVRTCLVAMRDLEWGGSKIVDADGIAHHQFSAGVPCVYLIRPDGYVGFRSLGADPLPLLDHLNRVYEPAPG